jgi:hypothetical protein
MGGGGGRHFSGQDVMMWQFPGCYQFSSALVLQFPL